MRSVIFLCFKQNEFERRKNVKINKSKIQSIIFKEMDLSF